jgi:regulator of nucleoside diphosphate kinase
MLLGHQSIIARKVISMPQNRRIVVTDGDLVVLHRLACHPRLEAELKNAVVVDSRRVPSDVVTMHSRVQFEDETTGECREVTIVYPQQADASRALISVLAPTGTALLGLAVGQSIVWPFPDGATRRLRVLKLVYQPEADEVPSQQATRKRHAPSKVR